MEQQILKLLEKLNDGIDLASGQLPDIAQQILNYEFSNSILALVVAFLFIIIAVFLFYFKTPVCLGFMVAMVGLFTACLGVDGLIKIKTAPKLVVIEKLTSYIKK